MDQKTAEAIAGVSQQAINLASNTVTSLRQADLQRQYASAAASGESGAQSYLASLTQEQQYIAANAPPNLTTQQLAAYVAAQTPRPATQDRTWMFVLGGLALAGLGAGVWYWTRKR